MDDLGFDRLRILALDLHPQRYGFAVLEGASRLLDWGTSTYSRAEHGVLFGSLSPLFTVFSPELVAIGDPADWSSLRYSGTVSAMRVARKEVSWRSLPILQVSRNEIKDTFAVCKLTNKNQISAVISLLFPQLVWRLPAARRAWESESQAQAVFDAIALAITCLGRFGDLDLHGRVSGEFGMGK